VAYEGGHAAKVGQGATAKTEQAALKLEGKGVGAVRTTTTGAKVESVAAGTAATEVKAASRLSRVGSGLAKMESVKKSGVKPLGPRL
jgi:hypothetical protein